MPGIDFRQVRTRISIAQVLALIRWDIRAAARGQVRGACPLHGSAEDSRVFSVNLTRNVFQCFKCGARGNQLDLWAALTKQSLYDAALELCRRLNQDVPWLGGEQRRGTRKLEVTQEEARQPRR